MSGETEQSDFAGIVAMSTVAALDGCPWVEKGHLWELSSAVAELVVARVGEVDSLLMPNGAVWRAVVSGAERLKLRNVIADAMFDAYYHDANGVDAEDILTALDEAGYNIIRRAPAEPPQSRCSHGGDAEKCNVGYVEHLVGEDKQ